VAGSAEVVSAPLAATASITTSRPRWRNQTDGPPAGHAHLRHAAVKEADMATSDPPENSSMVVLHSGFAHGLHHAISGWGAIARLAALGLVRSWSRAGGVPDGKAAGTK
jgi:hypothetical protein